REMSARNAAVQRRAYFTESLRSRDPDELVHLQAEAPARMSPAVLDGARGVLDAIRPVHRLQVEQNEVQIGDALRCDRVREDELQLLTAPHAELGPGLGAHREPVDAAGRQDGAVRLHGDLETTPVALLDDVLVELQQRLAPREHDVRLTRLCGGGTAPG